MIEHSPTRPARRGTDSGAVRSAGGTALVGWNLLVAGVLMLFVSRATVAYASIPTAVNFAHFPLLFGAFVLSRGRTRNVAERRAGERVLAISLVLAAASVIGSPTSPVLQTALVWAVLVEPIVVILAVWNLAERGVPPRKARNLALLVVIGQLPIVGVQWALFGTGDRVQGMLVNQGAGHHLLGMLGLVVALVGFGRFVRPGSESRPLVAAILLLASGLALPVLTDTRQGIIVFIVVVVAVAPAAIPHGKSIQHHAPRVVVVAFLLLTLMVAAVAGSRAFSLASREPWRAPSVVEAKVEAITTIVEAMSHQPFAPLVGLGGGATATRVAWLASDTLGANSYLSGFDLPPSPVASDLAEQWVRNPRWAASSASSPFATWSGVFGDLGLLGLAAYAAMWWLPWRRSTGRPDQLETRAVVLFLVLLGLLFNWLEEPQLAVVAALVIAAGGARTPSLAASVATGGRSVPASPRYE